MSDHDKDRLVDAVARHMTTVTDDPAFRARVVSRLSPRVELPRSPGWIVPAAASICVMVGVAGAVQLMREPGVVPAAPRVVTAPPGAEALLASAATPVDDTGSAEMVLARRAVSRPPVALSIVPALPLLSTDPLVPMADIQPAAIPMPLLDVTPIATAPLVLAPVDGGKD